jgi:hypothetical protein
MLKRSTTALVGFILATIALAVLPAQTPGRAATTEEEERESSAQAFAGRLVREGQEIFRFDTLGSEGFFSDALRLHEALNGVPPATALAVGLKVDSLALPRELRRAIQEGAVDLDDPANTVALLSLDAVVGISADVEDGAVTRMGITCALCHSVVDDSVTTGVGKRLDGWANRDLDVGTILSLSPDLTPLADLLGVDVDTVLAVLTSWGAGKFDAHLNLDGRAFQPDGSSAAVLIPPAFGLAGVNLHTYTGWGSVAYWNAFVGNLEMNGSGTFYDPRLNDAQKFPIAAANGFGDRRANPDLITSKLPALHLYQLALAAPAPPKGSYDAAAAARGEALFSGKADCVRCHVPPLYTEPGWALHEPGEIGIDDFQASRSPDERYRTTPLAGLWTHTSGGFYHDGRFQTLAEVIDHYDLLFTLSLEESEKLDLAEFLESI